MEMGNSHTTINNLFVVFLIAWVLLTFISSAFILRRSQGAQFDG